MGWTTEIRFSEGTGLFLFATASRSNLGPTEPPIQWVSEAISTGINWPERGADHSPPLRICGTMPLVPQYVFMVLYLIRPMHVVKGDQNGYSPRLGIGAQG
jgi:hypothetical protein